MSYSELVCVQGIYTHIQTKGGTIRVDTLLPRHKLFHHINIRNELNNSFLCSLSPQKYVWHIITEGEENDNCTDTDHIQF